jgi:tight adherence protein C
MFDYIAAKMTDPQFILGVLVGLGTLATFATTFLPALQNDNLEGRMKAVVSEREFIRAREREKLNNEKPKVRHNEAKGRLKDIVDQFKLQDYLWTSNAKTLLMQAGHRSQESEYIFLFARAALPTILFFAMTFYAMAIMESDLPVVVRLGIGVVAGLIGLQLPEMFLKNIIQKRQMSMRRAFPDALDLMLICVESGMALEPTFNKVAAEIATQSPELAEEFAITTAELSYLPQRRAALENLTTRTGLDPVKQLSTVLIQSERYGTPLGTALRVISQETRDNRMMEAEKKAAALPPKLTVPMIIFFLPVLFAVIITPAALQVSGVKGG